MKFNYSKLRGKIRECNLTQEQLADAIDINKSTLSAKLNCQFAFTTEEMLSIGAALNIPKNELCDYFFAE